MNDISSISLLRRLVFLVFAIWVLAALLIFSLLPSWSERGQFGDLFGAVNALFSGLAFAGLFYTIYLQREELALQREELRLQREEMKGSRMQLENQASAQRALFLATIGQIKVAAIQAKMEAIKLECEHGSGYKGIFVERLKTASIDIEGIALGIETEANTG